MSDAETIVLTVVAFFVILALLTFARVILRRSPPSYRRFRVGVFVERDDYSDPDELDEDDGSITQTFPRG